MLDRPKRLPPAPAALLVAALAVSAPLRAAAQGADAPPPVTLPPDTDVAPLGSSLDAWLEARSQGEDTEAAEARVREELARLERELGADPLRWPELPVRALRAARSFDRAVLEKGRVSEASFAEGSFRDAPLALVYRLPRTYAPDERDYPLVLALPDAGERPADHLRTFWSARPFREEAIVVTCAMPEDPAGWDRVMLRGRPGGLAHALGALRFASERFAVDPERVFVAGRGASVTAALGTGNYAPQRFAGILARACTPDEDGASARTRGAPVRSAAEHDAAQEEAGAGGGLGDLGPANFLHLPTCFTRPDESAEAFAAAARAAGHDNATLLPGDEEEPLWLWMRDHPRVVWPSSLRLVTGDPFPTRVAWLRVAPAAPGANATASIDRARGVVSVTTEGVSAITLYLSDALVDLDRPVRVVCDGVDEERRFERRPLSMLDMLRDGTSDAGCVYVVRATFETGGRVVDEADAVLPEPDAALAARLASAGDDPAALWTLHEALAASGEAARDTLVLRRLLRFDPDHAAARAALGQHGEAGQWFDSLEAWERFRAGQDPARAAAHGSVESRGRWIHPDERSLASRGDVKDFASGTWLRPGEARRLRQGWVRQDLAWIPPDEAPLVDRGLWLADGEWVPLTEADRRHARIDAMWHVPRGAVLLHTTCPRRVALRAALEMERAIDDLERVFGARPRLPLEVTLLRDEEQYDRFAFGDPDGRRLPTHTGRLQAIESAFLAESLFERVDGELVHHGMGVGYWDTDAPNGDLYGRHAARLAFGLSWVDAVDPSPKAVKKALARGPERGFAEAYEAEKELPAWLRWGGAGYAERWFRDDAAAEGIDPWWTRRWSLDNLQRLGGLRALDEVFAFALDPDDRDDARKLLLEAGLLVAFALDGDCAPVREAHAALCHALVAGSLHPKDVRAFEEALREHEAELRAFAR